MVIAVGLALGAAILGLFVGRDTKHPKSSAAVTVQASRTVDPHVAAGAHISCSSPAPSATAIRVAAACRRLSRRSPLWPRQLTAAQLRPIIDHGLGESANPKNRTCRSGARSSPTHRSRPGRLYPRRPAGGADRGPPPIPAAGRAVEGAPLPRYGCINCHGPNGLGGVPNPQSPDKTIPPLSGADFRQRVQHRRQDHRRDPKRQRARTSADRQHAPLGRHHPAAAAQA